MISPKGRAYFSADIPNDTLYILCCDWDFSLPNEPGEYGDQVFSL